MTFTVPRSMGDGGRTLVIVMSGDENSGSLDVASAEGTVGTCAARPGTGTIPPDAKTHTSAPGGGVQGQQSQAG